VIYWVDNGGSYSDHSVDTWNVPDDVAADFEKWMATRPGERFIVGRADYMEIPKPEDVTSFVGYFGGEVHIGPLESLFGWDEDEAVAKWVELPASLQHWLLTSTSERFFVEKHFSNFLKPAPTDGERAAKALAWREGRAKRLRDQEMALQIQLDPTSTKAVTP
jgi:hypothetical protein